MSVEFILIALFISSIIVAIISPTERSKNRREKYIQEYQFSSSIVDKIKKTYPHLNEENIHLVLRALKEYFLMNARTKNQKIAMPSKVVDLAWHEFILHTQHYSQFCKKAFGYFLHHSPTAAVSKNVQVQQESASNGMRSAWRLSSKSEYSQVEHLSMPLLFAIDELLKIPDGQYYNMQCSNNAKRKKSRRLSKSSSNFNDSQYNSVTLICVSEFATGGYSSCSSDNNSSCYSDDRDRYSDNDRYNDCSSNSDISSCSSCSSCSSSD